MILYFFLHDKRLLFFPEIQSNITGKSKTKLRSNFKLCALGAIHKTKSKNRAQFFFSYFLAFCVPSTPQTT